ncbi:MAG: hypothetical protein HQL90_13990 [Magnetococcales bacterium]|nr:hypothetical protein [Magnetococcales bacterium]
MNHHPAATPPLSAAAAIQTALTAETEAMQAVARCRAQAEKMVDDARRQASEIATQADLRISDLHKEYNKRIRKQEENAQEESHRQRLPTATQPEGVLQTAVQQLAAWLTGERQELTSNPSLPHP